MNAAELVTISRQIIRELRRRVELEEADQDVPEEKR